MNEAETGNYSVQDIHLTEPEDNLEGTRRVGKIEGMEQRNGIEVDSFDGTLGQRHRTPQLFLLAGGYMIRKSYSTQMDKWNHGQFQYRRINRS